jgi:hypothetical protein
MVRFDSGGVCCSGDLANTCSFLVHITENGRAYPDYLVRYYRGARDPDRTPYADKNQAMMSIQRPACPTEDDDLDVDTTETGLAGNDTSASAGNVSWEYADDSGWTSYGDSHQAVLEASYQNFLRNKPTTTPPCRIQTNAWAYEVDFEGMVQTNLGHPGHRLRPVRRVGKF